MTLPSKATDRRVERTRRALGDALVKLLGERVWDDIGVQDLCDVANVGRSTFYMHFANKEELLESSLGNLSAMLRAAARERGGGRPAQLAFAHALIEHVREQRRIFRSVVGRRSGQAVQQRFRDMVIALVREDLTPALREGWQAEARVRFVAGALLELLAWAVDTRQTPSAEELEKEFCGLAESALGRAAR